MPEPPVCDIYYGPVQRAREYDLADCFSCLILPLAHRPSIFPSVKHRSAEDQPKDDNYSLNLREGSRQADLSTLEQLVRAGARPVPANEPCPRLNIDRRKAKRIIDQPV